MENNRAKMWQMTGVDQPLELKEVELGNLAENEALVEVAGCGVCHTDMSFWHDGVPVRHSLPLTLGHEISGTVVKGFPELQHKNVVIPAVLPCGECALCKSGRSNICRNQQMPGNDFHGGFSSHVKVPEKYLCPVPPGVLKEYSLEELAVVADAISTPYQVIKKSELKEGDLAIIIGLGGLGIYGAQIAKAFGARVVGLDISGEKLEMAGSIDIDATLNIRDMDKKSMKKEVKAISKKLGTPGYGWKIFEMSGTKPGQEAGFGLVTFASTLSVVGFTLSKPDVRLSNLMAFDAKAIGTWGCRAELYPGIMEMIGRGDILIKPFVQKFPMSQINEVFNNTLEHKYSKRSIMIPDF